MDARLMEAETIVFDVGNVLLSFEPEKVLALLPEQGRDEMLHALFGPAMLWSGFDLGRDGNDAVAERIAQAAGFPEAMHTICPHPKSDLPMAVSSALRCPASRVPRS